MSRFNRYPVDNEGELINLTPLLDVLFVVLILFMLAAPLLQIDKISLSKGSIEKEEFSDHGVNTLKIQVTHDNVIEIQNKKIPVKLLQATFIALHQQFPNITPTLFCDKGASFGTYQIIKNSLEEAGFREMEVILKSS
ncbi:MAG: biopolymer transporter ExbD [Rhabdochlamydiaceae bacterium]|nr:biopolymer transporter ExbD [Candidatus Amphrikana amoebophyrae]